MRLRDIKAPPGCRELTSAQFRALAGADDTQKAVHTQPRQPSGTPATFPEDLALKPDSPETLFYSRWLAAGGPELTRQYRFHPGRRWRADFAYLPAKVLIEIDGITYGRGGWHQAATHYADDREKDLSAILMGYTVIRLVQRQLTPEILESIINHLRRIT